MGAWEARSPAGEPAGRAEYAWGPGGLFLIDYRAGKEGTSGYWVHGAVGTEPDGRYSSCDLLRNP